MGDDGGFKLVTEVRFTSAREDGLLTVYVESHRNEFFFLLTNHPDAEITVDGAKVAPHRLLGHLFSARYWMRAFPEVERYDCAVKAEFKLCKET